MAPPWNPQTAVAPLTPESLFIIAGPCVIESEALCLGIAERLAALAAHHRIAIVFKASYDKANRTAAGSFRGPGRREGLRVLEKVKRETGLPLLTDIHHPEEAAEAAGVADILQIPAFLCRQTDLLTAAAATGRLVNVKKGQFMAPADMRYVIEKAGPRTMLTERGTFFGYNRLVVDFPGIHIMKALGVPVLFDATHSVQAPGGGGGSSAGNRDHALPLAMSALCHRIDGLFFEVHPSPESALCDGPNSLALDTFAQALPRLTELDRRVREWEG
jgi:2-dehydro-3-deoxyphosphooctonate aldolase (KDO 8-P synthase)